MIFRSGTGRRRRKGRRENIAGAGGTGGTEEQEDKREEEGIVVEKGTEGGAGSDARSKTAGLRGKEMHRRNPKVRIQRRRSNMRRGTSFVIRDQSIN